MKNAAPSRRKPRARGAANPETARQTDVLKVLTMLGIQAWRQSPHATPIVRDGRVIFRRGVNNTGISDIGAVVPGGRYMAVEVKMPDGQCTVEQEAFLTSVAKRGGIAVVVHCGNDIMALAHRARECGGWSALPSPWPAAERMYVTELPRVRA